MEGYTVRVEVDISPGLPAFHIVGLPDTAIQESKERVRAAILNSEFDFPLSRVTVNLAPADTKKEGPSFDLPIALAILSATGQLNSERLKSYCQIGELSLDGLLRRVNGILPVAQTARERGLKGLIVAPQNASEAALVEGIEVVPCESLRESFEFLRGQKAIEPHKVDVSELFSGNSKSGLDFDDVKGQEHVKRALEVCAAGMHNLMMVGPPGSGKTMLARRLTSILPPLTIDEAISVTKIYSITGLLNSRYLMTARPFRSPHHTISHIGLIGGGSGIPRPGEVSLSHNGVLFLDEFPEFNKNALEVLRQPMEDGSVTISRSLASVTYPARFTLIAALNPCPCGYFGDPKKRCTCPPYRVQQYLGKISGPLLDRIDIHIHVPRLTKREIVNRACGSSSKEMKKRVIAAHKRQLERFRQNDSVKFNSHLGTKELQEVKEGMSENAKQFLEEAIERLNFSARAYDRIIKLSITIADLEESDSIELRHVAEAIQYRSLDRIPSFG